MKITLKDLKQNKFVIEAEPTETVAELKAKIQKEKGFESSAQKLIYSGKILQDANTIASYNIEEKGFVVCMTSKPKPAAASSSKPAPATPAPAPAQTPAAPAPPAAPAQSSSAAPNVPATPSPAPAAGQTERQFNDPSALTLGSERDEAIANMESMGFPRAEVERAMRAAYFNPDRAVEYLLNGIPESALRDQQQGSPAQARGPTSPPATGGDAGAAAAAPTEGDAPINLFEAAAQAGQNRGGAGGARSGGTGGAAPALGGNSLDFLRNNPQFQQLRQVVQQQPQMLEPILQQVAQGNPQLAQLINQNPDAFIGLLAENDDDEALPPGATAISVNEEEREAIERLCRLGFERDLVIQAYFACDKNEELAANFLFDQPDDDDQ